MENVTMPKLGLTMTEGTISQWKVSRGDVVKKGDVLLVVATEKLTYEVEAPSDGTVLDVRVKEGETVPVGSVLAVMGEEGEKVSSGAEAEVEAPEEPAPEAKPLGEPLSGTKEAVWAGTFTPASPQAKKWANAFGLELAEIEGSGPGGRVVKDDVMKEAARFRATPLARKLAREGGADTEQIPGSGSGGRTTAEDVKHWLAERPTVKVKASPVASRMAEDLGVDLESIEKDGRIMKEDVLAAAGARQESEPAGVPSGDAGKRQPLTQMQKIIAERMAWSASTIPSVFFNVETDFSEFLKTRKILNESVPESGRKVSFNDLLMKICAVALSEHPLANASYDSERQEYTLHEDANIGLAVAVEGGLLVPNVKAVQRKSLGRIAADSADVVERARKGKLLPDDMEGGTFTITNLGMFGTHDFIPIINPPEACILAVNAVIEKPVVRDGEVTVRPMSMIGLSADHRILNGADAARFLARIRELVENPCKILM